MNHYDPMIEVKKSLSIPAYNVRGYRTNFSVNSKLSTSYYKSNS